MPICLQVICFCFLLQSVSVCADILPFDSKAVCYCCLCVEACGLYYMAELAEEYPTFTKAIIKWSIVVSTHKRHRRDASSFHTSICHAGDHGPASYAVHTRTVSNSSRCCWYRDALYVLSPAGDELPFHRTHVTELSGILRCDLAAWTDLL